MSGCHSLNFEKLNQPSKRYSALNQGKELKSLEEQGWAKDIINLSKEDSEYKLKRRLSTRQRIIDSLQIPLNKLIIVDYLSHGTAGPFEVNYFIYDSSFISISYSTSRTPRENLLSGKIEDLKRKFPTEAEMLTEIYNKFYLNYPNIPKKFDKESSGSTYYSYEITLPKNNKVNFYKFSNFDDFIVYQLIGKRLLPL